MIENFAFFSNFPLPLIFDNSLVFWLWINQLNDSQITFFHQNDSQCNKKEVPKCNHQKTDLHSIDGRYFFLLLIDISTLRSRKITLPFINVSWTLFICLNKRRKRRIKDFFCFKREKTRKSDICLFFFVTLQ